MINHQIEIRNELRLMNQNLKSLIALLMQSQINDWNGNKGVYYGR